MNKVTVRVDDGKYITTCHASQCKVTLSTGFSPVEDRRGSFIGLVDFESPTLSVEGCHTDCEIRRKGLKGLLMAWRYRLADIKWNRLIQSPRGQRGLQKLVEKIRTDPSEPGGFGIEEEHE